ncbi:MAG: O-antigen ligase family protein [Oscillospiraceae bacterium]
MVPDIFTNKEYNKYDKFLMLTAFIGGLLPEYIAPFLILFFFPIFKKNWSHIGRKVVMGKQGKTFFVFMCFMLSSMVWSKTRIYSAAISLLWMGMFLGYLIIANSVDTKKKIENILLCLSASGAGAGLCAVLQMSFLAIDLQKFFPNPIYTYLNNLIFKILPFEIQGTYIIDRASGTFDNPLILATFLIIVMPLSIFLCFYASTKKRKILATTATVFIFLGILFTYSRGAAIAVVVSLIMLTFLGKKTAITMLLVSLVSSGILPIVIRERRKFDSFIDESTVFRFAIWDTCFESIGKRPILGLGAGTENVAAILAEKSIPYPHAHNLFIEMTTELGFVGLIMLLSVFVLIFIDIFKIFKCGGWWKRISIAYLSMISGFISISMFEYTLQSPKELMYFMIALGLIEATKRVASKHKETYDATAISERNKLFNKSKNSKSEKYILK